MEPLPCSTIVYRAIRPKWVDPVTRTVLPIAFQRRPAPSDEDGLSVDILSAQSCAQALRNCQVASLHVGRVRDLGLDVVVDEPPHANIVGVPRQEEDRTAANRFAFELARQGRLIPPEHYQPAGS
jgi:hypothetical protein